MAAGPGLAAAGWLTLRCLVAGVFVYAGAMKAVDPTQFAVDLQGYRLLPSTVLPWLALYIPWVEIVCGCGLFLRPLRAGAWGIASVLTVGFVVFLGSAWARGLDVSCGCFGNAAPEPIGPLAIGRALLLTVLSVLGLRHDLPPKHVR